VFEPEPIIAALNEQGVEFVVIGMFAASLSVPEAPPTFDIDFTPETSIENLDRLSVALRNLDARIRVGGIDGGLPFRHNGQSLAAGQVWNLVCEFGEFDLSFTPSGTDGYADLVNGAEIRIVGEQAVTVSSLQDVIRSKSAAGRPKDLVVLPVLGAEADLIKALPVRYSSLVDLAHHLQVHPDRYQRSDLLDQIKNGNIRSLRTIDVAAVCEVFKIDPTEVFPPFEAARITNINAAPSISPIKGIDGLER
jgi:hypothetical protein